MLDSSLEGVSGKYFEGMREIPSSAESYDALRARELWEASVALTSGVPIHANEQSRLPLPAAAADIEHAAA